MEQENVQTEVQQGVAEQVEGQKSFKDIIKDLIAAGARRYNGLRIKNVKFSEEDNYTRVTLVVHPTIPGMISKDGGLTWEPGMTNNIFTSTFALAGMLKEDEEKSWLANTLSENPQALNIILNGGSVDVIQHTVKAGVPYKNPFSTREDATETTFDHDTIINYVVGFSYGKTGAKFADVLAVKMMGF